MNTKLIGGIIALAVVGGGSFYGGMQYQKSTAASARADFAGRQFGGQNGTRVRGGQGGGPIIGTVLSKDETGITIQMQDGSTKIVLVGGNAIVMHTTEASAKEFAVGDNVFVLGSSNSDGSITARSVEIRAGSIPSSGLRRDSVQ